MLLIRLLAIFLVLITNTWLLSPGRCDALSRHKRAMARRADRELSRLAGEPCAVPGVWRSRRRPRSLSPSQHRPPAARPRTHTSRREPHAVESAPAVCAGVCRFDTGARRGAAAGQGQGGWGDTEDVAAGAGDGYVTRPGRLYEKRSTNDGRDSNSVSTEPAQQPGLSLLEDAGQSASSAGDARSPRGSGSRFTRSADGTFPYEDEGNSSWEKVFPDSSTDSRGLRVLHRLQQRDGDQPSSTTGPLEDVTEDYSGEVEQADPPESQAAGGGSPPWGSPVPTVPPSWMTALYFSGRRERLRVKPAALELPRAKFSLELWVQPEGGQSNPAVIAGG